MRMTKLEEMKNDQMTKIGRSVSSAFGLRHSFVIRHSCFAAYKATQMLMVSPPYLRGFVISGVAILTLMIQMCCSAPAQAQSPNMTG